MDSLPESLNPETPIITPTQKIYGTQQRSAYFVTKPQKVDFANFRLVICHYTIM